MRWGGGPPSQFFVSFEDIRMKDKTNRFGYNSDFIKLTDIWHVLIYNMTYLLTICNIYYKKKEERNFYPSNLEKN